MQYLRYVLVCEYLQSWYSWPAHTHAEVQTGVVGHETEAHLLLCTVSSLKYRGGVYIYVYMCVTCVVFSITIVGQVQTLVINARILRKSQENLKHSCTQEAESIHKRTTSRSLQRPKRLVLNVSYSLLDNLLYK